MALFDKIKLGGRGSGAPGHAPADGAAREAASGVAADPAKAAKFFEKARTVHETSNFAYAATLWLQGLRQDPTSMSGLEGFMQSASSFAQSEKATKPTKDQLAQFGAKGPLEKYLEQLLHWGIRPSDSARGLKLIELAAKAGLSEPGHWIGQRVLLSILEDKPKKSDLLTLVRSLQDLQAYDLAVKAGEAACRLDPNDAGLQAEVRNLAAQNTMSRGGYEKTGQAGGFRQNVRDAEAQRRIVEEQSLTKSEATVERLLLAAREDYETRPNDRAAVRRYATALRERGRPEDDKTAHDLLLKAFEELQEFQFRQMAGEIRLKHARRKVSQLRQAAEAAPGDGAAQEQARKAQEAYQKIELEEFILRSANYPTDLGLKLEVGIRHFALGQDEQAIALFQDARNDPKNRGRALHYLGQSFLRMGWADEAVDTLRASLAALESQTDEAALEVRYNLMHALERKARDHADPVVADEAYKIASQIAMQQINYRDVRSRRDALQRLAKELRSPPPGPAPAPGA